MIDSIPEQAQRRVAERFMLLLRVIDELAPSEIVSSDDRGRLLAIRVQLDTMLRRYNPLLPRNP